MTHAIKVVFKQDFEEKNKQRPDPKDWVADECWIFLTTGGQPVEFGSRVEAVECATRLSSEWPSIRVDMVEHYDAPPIAWMVVELKEGEETWLI